MAAFDELDSGLLVLRAPLSQPIFQAVMPTATSPDARIAPIAMEVEAALAQTSLAAMQAASDALSKENTVHTITQRVQNQHDANRFDTLDHVQLDVRQREKEQHEKVLQKSEAAAAAQRDQVQRDKLDADRKQLELNQLERKRLETIKRDALLQQEKQQQARMLREKQDKELQEAEIAAAAQREKTQLIKLEADRKQLEMGERERQRLEISKQHEKEQAEHALRRAAELAVQNEDAARVTASAALAKKKLEADLAILMVKDGVAPNLTMTPGAPGGSVALFGTPLTAQTASNAAVTSTPIISWRDRLKQVSFQNEFIFVLPQQRFDLICFIYLFSTQVLVLFKVFGFCLGGTFFLTKS